MPVLANSARAARAWGEDGIDLLPTRPRFQATPLRTRNQMVSQPRKPALSVGARQPATVRRVGIRPFASKISTSVWDVVVQSRGS